MSTLAPDVLPARPRSGDSGCSPAPDTLPFGLTVVRVLAPGEAVVDLRGLRYDPVLQLSVTADGRPAVAVPGEIHAATHYDTQYDTQWFTDKD